MLLCLLFLFVLCLKCMCLYLVESLQVFRQGMFTLCNATIEDTLATVKSCEAARSVVLRAFFLLFLFEHGLKHCPSVRQHPFAQLQID